MTCDYFSNAHIYVQIWVIIVATSVLAGTELGARTESQSPLLQTAEPNI